jgi:hypothetical protein
MFGKIGERGFRQSSGVIAGKFKRGLEGLTVMG